MKELKSILVGTFNTPELFHLVFDPHTESLAVSAVFPAHGNHSWLALGPPRDGGHRNLYATAWTDPTSVAAYRVVDQGLTQGQGQGQGQGGLELTLQNTAPTRARSGYVAVGKQPADVLYTVGGPTGEVLRLNETDGRFREGGDATLQYLDFIHGHVQRAGGAGQTNGHAGTNGTNGLENGKTMDFGGLRNGSHSIDLSPDGTLAYVADIGRNAFFVYEVDGHDGALRLAEKKASPRSDDGPRHVWPHHGGRVVYVLQEHSCAVDVFEVVAGPAKAAVNGTGAAAAAAAAAANGKAEESGAVHLELRQSVRIIPDELDQKLFWADEVRTSAPQDARFLLASTRGLEPGTLGYVALFELDEQGYIRNVPLTTSKSTSGAGSSSAVPHRSKWSDILQTPTSGGWANAVEPCYELLGTNGRSDVYAALTDSEKGLVMMLKVERASAGAAAGKASLREVARVKLGMYKDQVRGAATASSVSEQAKGLVRSAIAALEDRPFGMGTELAGEADAQHVALGRRGDGPADGRGRVGLAGRCCVVGRGPLGFLDLVVGCCDEVVGCDAPLGPGDHGENHVVLGVEAQGAVARVLLRDATKVPCAGPVAAVVHAGHFVEADTVLDSSAARVPLDGTVVVDRRRRTDDGVGETMVDEELSAVVEKGLEIRLGAVDVGVVLLSAAHDVGPCVVFERVEGPIERRAPLHAELQPLVGLLLCTRTNLPSIVVGE
ncbi:hypothetical protein FA10DRAFT_263261 [Acaromyces ingoldii]|uniref:Isomerase YbhE n=1 Tax=Acaromyces ingoldii TaxID=215250 RepID=A0A316YB73_9BASI|nr:hypothetical protein FA10DRAFT_263261 [Acaromyces ingoldii]PWN86549.1 hypothetical protein FA10DRAFT_263261 [Acaromyces ingoldii]